MHMTCTLDIEVLTVTKEATNPHRHQLVVKLVMDPFTAGANITTRNIATKALIQQLETFVTTNTANTILSHLAIETWTQQTYMEVLGVELGTRILEVVTGQQERIATKLTPTDSAGA